MISPAATFRTTPYSLNQARSAQGQTARGFGLPEGMMGLGDELEHHIASYLSRAIAADDLFGRLASVAPEATAAPDVFTRETWGTAFLLLSELGSGDLREDDVRHQLRALVSCRAPGPVPRPAEIR